MKTFGQPNFLGIGAVRGGSTWLYHLIASHPEFYLPIKRKEIQYFTRFYDKGEYWYRNLFIQKKSKFVYQGEITPGYLIAPNAPERIKGLQTVSKFVLILRNPVDRAYSHYKWHLRVTGEKRSFKDFYTRLARLAIENGMYYKYLSKFLEHFEQDQFLILIYEEVIKNPQIAIESLSNFFDVTADDFSIPSRKNESIIPRYRKLFRIAHKATSYLRKYDLDIIPNLLIKMGFKNAFGKAKALSIPKPCFSEKTELFNIFKEDIKSLERLLDRNLEIWKS